jgi:hypothetical protein
MKGLNGENCELVMSEDGIHIQLWRIYGRSRITIDNENISMKIEADSLEEIKRLLEKVTKMVKNI